MVNEESLEILELEIAMMVRALQIITYDMD